LVKEVLDAVGVETEFVSLAGKTIGPCIACLGCVKDNVCKVNDDMEQLRQLIGETCKAGAIHRFFGPGTKITPDIIPDLSKQPGKLEEARAAGRKLGERLKG
jgi:hypothetical protein